MSDTPSAVPVLLDITAKARALRGRTVAVKLGGSALEDADASQGTLECLVALQMLGVQLVVVHGGGKPIDRAMADAGITPRKVLGRRYTDDATLEIVVRVLHDIRDDLDRRIEELGGRAVGPERNALFGERLTLEVPGEPPVDLGRVGKVTCVDTPALHRLMDEGIIPVLPSLATDADGGWLNVNADTVASAVAGAFRAVAALFLTDTPGVLFDRSDTATRFARLSERQCRDLISSGVISAGMIPKVEACLDALDAGAERAVILDGRNPHSLLHWFLGEPSGTEIVR